MRHFLWQQRVSSLFLSARRYSPFFFSQTILTFFWWAKESYKENPPSKQNLKINFQLVR
jgi:hypothetical protein